MMHRYALLFDACYIISSLDNIALIKWCTNKKDTFKLAIVFVVNGHISVGISTVLLSQISMEMCQFTRRGMNSLFAARK